MKDKELLRGWLQAILILAGALVALLPIAIAIALASE
jgi:hypothetical protein